MTKNRNIKDIMKDIEKIYFQLGKLYGELERLLKKGDKNNEDFKK